MKGRLAIFVTVVVTVFVLVALNAASYVRVEQSADTEDEPDRSTFNSGATGTRALFEYLKQTGRDAVRWRLPVSELSNESNAGEAPAFVVVGKLRGDFSRADASALLRWVERGGRLVVIDRSPDPQPLPTSGSWRVVSEVLEAPDRGVRADDAEEMTRGVELVRPAQPTALTRDVAGVSRSRFAGRLSAYRVASAAGYDTGGVGSGGVVGPARAPDEEGSFEEEYEDQPPPPAPVPAASPGAPVVSVDTDTSEQPVSTAPVSHLDDGRPGSGSMLVDYAYGRGRVVVMSDPYVVSNAGINRADNLFLAVNLVAGGRGRILFDEFHQGYGGGRNETLAYFRGTPVVWLFAQGALVALALVWTRGRRFARSLPAPSVDRRSKLEFVASMAELQQRARAYDLALENVYARTRRALARYGGLPPTSPPERIAERVAARSGGDKAALEALLRECEDACAGPPLKARRALELARSLRGVERELGLLMRSREIRQTK